jgi:hypothetical protein
MQASWWQHRQWRFLADMNGDGVVTTTDVPLWAEWFFFLPGDSVIAQFGSTPFGRFLELTPASFGSATSAAISAPVWLLAISAAFCLPGFVLDIFDPTYRQQKREQREAQRARKRRERLTRRKPPRFFRRHSELPVEERREPRFVPDLNERER